MFRHFTRTLLLALVLALLAPLTALAATPGEALVKGADWTVTQQQADGSFIGFGAGSTADALIGLAAAGRNPATLAKGGKTPIDFLAANASTIAADPGIAAKTVIGLLRAGRSPRSAIGVDLVAAVRKGYDETSGHIGADVTAHALGMIALVAAGEQLPPNVASWLTSMQLGDGSWSFTGEKTPGAGDTNTTALALQALVAAGQKDTQAVRTAEAYLRSQQNADGGFPYSQTSSFGNASDANSTALVIQAVIALGQDPASWAKDGHTPLERLLAFQNTSGAFRYQDSFADDNQLATYQALPALARQSFPLEPIVIAAPEPTPAPTPMPLPDTGVQPVPVELPNTAAPAGVPSALVLAALALLLAGAVLKLR